jgi:Cu+-exporting ATPase
VVEHVKRRRQKYGSQTEHFTEVKDFEVHTGAGVRGNVGEAIVLVGNKRLMRACSIPVGPEVEDYILKNEQHVC